MKKWKLLISIAAVSLCMAACGKSEAVKNVEEMIGGLGEVSLESGDAIGAAEDAYNALTEDEKAKVENYEALTSAKTEYTELSDAYYEELLVGEWMKSSDISLYSVTKDEDESYLSLDADMSSMRRGEDKGTWSVENGVLINTVTEKDQKTKYSIVEENGTIKLAAKSYSLIPIEAYNEYLNEIIKVVEISDENVNDLFDFYLFEEQELDDFGERTGEVSTEVMLRNKLFEDGWYYIDGADVAIEVVIPEHTSTLLINGQSEPYAYEREAKTVTRSSDNPYNRGVFSINHVIPGVHEEHSDVSIDQLTFGRVKGTLYFINGDYVKEVVEDEGARMLVFADGHPFSGEDHFAGTWVEGLDY